MITLAGGVLQTMQRGRNQAASAYTVDEGEPGPWLC